MGKTYRSKNAGWFSALHYILQCFVQAGWPDSVPNEVSRKFTTVFNEN